MGRETRPGVGTERILHGATLSPSTAPQLSALAQVCGHLSGSPVTAHAVLMETRRQLETMYAVPPRPYRLAAKSAFTMSAACAHLLRSPRYPHANLWDLPIPPLVAGRPFGDVPIADTSITPLDQVRRHDTLAGPSYTSACPPLFKPAPAVYPPACTTASPCAKQPTVSPTDADENEGLPAIKPSFAIASSSFAPVNTICLADDVIAAEASSLVANLGCQLDEAIRLVKAQKERAAATSLLKSPPGLGRGPTASTSHLRPLGNAGAPSGRTQGAGLAATPWPETAPVAALNCSQQSSTTGQFNLSLPTRVIGVDALGLRPVGSSPAQFSERRSTSTTAEHLGAMPAVGTWPSERVHQGQDAYALTADENAQLIMELLRGMLMERPYTQVDVPYYP